MIVSLALFSSIVTAQDIAGVAKVDPTKTSEPYDFHFEYGLMYYNFDYEEDLPSPSRSTDDGWVPGAYMGYAYKKKDSVYAKLFLEVTNGETDFDGTARDGTAMVYSENPQSFYRVEANMGYVIDAGDDFSITPYAGYGYRYWERGQGKAISTFWNYREEFTWSYIPVGVKADFESGTKWGIGANVGARFMFNGQSTAYLSEVYPDLGDHTFDLGNKTGYFAEMPIRCEFLPRLSVVGTPWYEYSSIGQSTEANVTYKSGTSYVGESYKAGSTTKQYGVKLGLIYSF